MNSSPKTIGFLQAAGLTFYVSCFAFTASRFQAVIKPGPIVGIAIFLLAFIISATACAALMFGYPYCLFIRNFKFQALLAVLWSIAWLFLILAALLAAAIL